MSRRTATTVAVLAAVVGLVGFDVAPWTAVAVVLVTALGVAVVDAL